MNIQKAINTVNMYFPLMPDCYKRYYLEGGPDSICMEVHMIGTETVFTIFLDHGKREDRKDMRLSIRSGGESESTYGFHT